MAAEHAFKFPRTSDRRIDEVFKAAAVRWAANDGSARLVSGITANCGFRSNPDENWATVLEADDAIAASVELNIGGFTIQYERGGFGSNAEKSAFLDEIRFTWHARPSTPSDADRIAIVRHFQHELGPVETTRATGIGLQPEQLQVQAIHQSVLNSLSNTAQDLIKKTADYRTTLDNQLEEKRKSLEDEFQAFKQKLEVADESRQKKLSQKEEQLAAKLKEIDARDNTIVRREIRDGMLSEAKQRTENFGVSAATVAKRRNVRYGIGFMALIFLFVLLLTATELWRYQVDRSEIVSYTTSTSTYTPGTSEEERAKSWDRRLSESTALFNLAHAPSDRYWLWARLAAISLGLVATLLYYIRWENAWAERHANAEFQLQQFHLDVNRASWVIESCLEWRKETTGSPIPSELLTSITRNLFTDRQSQPEQVIHPADELASAILGSAANVRLKTAAADIDIERPGKKLAGKTVSKNQSTG